MMVVPFRCDAFVDQRVYIGGDPVGYKCSGEAVAELGDGALLCKDCRAMLFAGQARRLTFMWPWGKELQQSIIESIVKENA